MKRISHEIETNMEHLFGLEVAASQFSSVGQAKAAKANTLLIHKQKWQNDELFHKALIYKYLCNRNGIKIHTFLYMITYAY